MWTVQNGDSVYYYERVKDPMTGKLRKLSVTLKGKITKAQEKKARELLEEKKREALGFAKKDGYTLGEVSQYYLEDQKRTVSEQTYIRNMRAVTTLKKILGADVIIDRLTSRYVREALNNSGRSNRTLNEDLRRFKAWMRWAYRNELTQDIQWLDKLTAYPDEEKKEELANKYLEPEELAFLIDSMEVPHWKDLTQFQVLTGMRVGECLALKFENIDLDKKVILVDSSVSAITGKIGGTKTRATREVYIQKELMGLCKKLIFEAKKRNIRNYKGIDSEFVFAGIDGAPLDYYAYNKYLRETGKRVLPDKHMTTHVLRHTHVALMAAAGASLDAISRRVGHQDSKITKEVYFHVTKMLKEKDNAEFENLVLIRR